MEDDVADPPIASTLKSSHVNFHSMPSEFHDLLENEAGSNLRRTASHISGYYKYPHVWLKSLFLDCKKLYCASSETVSAYLVLVISHAR